MIFEKVGLCVYKAVFKGTKLFFVSSKELF